MTSTPLATPSSGGNGLQKLPTGIPGFDHIAAGGLPLGRTTLIAGTAGSAKTVFAAQFLVAGIQQFGETGVFVTFEEPASDLRQNLRGFGWSIEQWEAENRWAFVDASPSPDAAIVIGQFDLAGLLARIEAAVRRVNAKRVVLDSLGGIFAQFTDSLIIRHELLRIAVALKAMGVTSVITAERPDDSGPITRFAVEEFVADNVVIFRNLLEQEKRRRTIEILKFRGTFHQKGQFPFTVAADRGVVVIPLSAISLRQKSSSLRISSGNPDLDRMCNGGFFRDSIILISGATGTGKTLLSTEFIAGGVRNGERCLLFAFEESRDQLFRNAAGWGVDYDFLERSGLLRVICTYPETASLEDHLIGIKAAIEEFRPQRLAVDSVSALERVSSHKGFREFIIGLTSFVKDQELAGLFTATSIDLLGGGSITESHFSTITDLIILLRYVEMFGEMRRGLTVLKMRGSAHDKDIREFTINERGMQVGKPFRLISGILAGRPQQHLPNEIERLEQLFQEGTGQAG